MTKRLMISSNDFELFDAELNSYEYEYFCKHIGAFKRFMQEEPREQKQLFLDAFCEYSYNHIEIKAIATMSDPKKKFIESFRLYAQEAFINGKFSTAKQFLNDSVIVARNKHMIHYMDSHSYAKDPFFHKETRDVFRRLFGEPTEAGTCVKVICVLPLFVRFAGSVCRYLKRWLDMEESLYPVFVKSKKNKKDKKAMKDLKIQQTRITISTSQQMKSVAENGGASGEQSTAVVPKKTENSKPADDEEDFSNFYYDMHERKKRKREVQKKGKRHEKACQHPCHGKVCHCNDHRALSHAGHDHNHMTCGHEHTIKYTEPENCQHPCHGKACHCHDDKGHDHTPNVDAASQQQMMSCLCTKHKALAEAKLAEKRAALEKHQTDTSRIVPLEDKNADDNFEKTSKVENSEKIPEKTPKLENSEKSSVDNTSVGKTSESETSEDKTSEVRTSEDKVSDGDSKDSGQSTSSQAAAIFDKFVEWSEGKKYPGKKSHKKIRSNGVVDSSDSSDCDAAVERFVRSAFPELHLGEPHPTEAYLEMVAKKIIEEKRAMLSANERERVEKMKEAKLRTCAACKSQETEVKTFKKCQKCKGKGTKFYCSRECQKLDWSKHRFEHH